MTSPGDIIAGKFRLERLVGRGGMGTVWCGRHLRLDMPVAIKFMEPGAADAPDARQRFEREARAAAQIRSPHVVQVLDHGIDNDLPYIVMELLEGEDLGMRLRRLGRMSLEEFEPILTQAAKGLRRAHDSGIVHRDLKPSNIFIARVDDEEIVKILDFGVAKVRWGSLGNMTQTGTLLGSPSYMSPEQARGRSVDHRSDLWSLGVIIFRVLTGVKPFSADSVAELIIKVCIEPPPVASQVSPGLSPELDAFFARAFQQDPERRFQSALEMAAELSAITRAGAGAARRSSPSISVSSFMSMPAPQAAMPAPQAAMPAPQAAAPVVQPGHHAPQPAPAVEQTVTPSSQSAPMPAEVYLQARAALEAAESMSASLEPDVPAPAVAPPPISAPRSSVAAIATPLPIPPSGPCSSVSSLPASDPRLGAPVLPVPPVEPAPPAFEPDDEVALYLAGGLGGPVAGAATPFGPDVASAPAGFPPQEPGVSDSIAPGGSSSTLTTTSRTLNAPSPRARRIILVSAVVAAVFGSLVLLASLLGGGSDAERQVTGVDPLPARSAAPAAPPAPRAPEAAPQPAPSPQPEAAPPPPEAAPEPPAPTEEPTPSSGSPGSGPAKPSTSPRPGGKLPGGSTKKTPGVDLGY